MAAGNAQNLEVHEKLMQALLLIIKNGDHLSKSQVVNQVAHGAPKDVAKLFSALAELGRPLSTHARKLAVSLLNYSFPENPPSELMDAYQDYVMALVDEDFSFTDDVFLSFTSRVFQFGNVEQLEVAIECTQDILDDYEEADRLLGKQITLNYPKHDSPTDYKVHYTSAVLEIAATCPDHALHEIIVRAVVDNLLVEQAYVPDEVYGEGQENAEGPVLHKQSEKMDRLLLVVFKFIDRIHEADPKGFARNVVESILQELLRLVLYFNCGRFLPCILLRAVTLAGSNVAEKTSDRLLNQFFSSQLGGIAMRAEVRNNYLALSAAIVGRSRVVSSSYCQRWAERLAEWANRYIETADHQYELFLGAVYLLVKVIVMRGDAIDSDMIHQFRVVRVLRSELNPSRSIPSKDMERFVEMAGLKGEWIFTSGGRAMSLSHLDLMRNTRLPGTDSSMAEFYRTSPKIC